MREQLEGIDDSLINGKLYAFEEGFDTQVIYQAFESAVRTAALALSIDVLVHHRNPEFSPAP